jgi:hypothetical protein
LRVPDGLGHALTLDWIPPNTNRFTRIPAPHGLLDQ